MQVEARFTLRDTEIEIPFTIVEDRLGRLQLYAFHEGVEHKFLLTRDHGLFKLGLENPFRESLEIVEERLIGLSSDFLEKQSQGFDSTAEWEGRKRPGYGPDDIFVENKPFSLKQVIDLIEGGDIELMPDFQRNFVWDKTRQSKLIESILLGLPLPSIYLSQYEDGRLTVVDGLQRLSTILSFMQDNLILTNLEYLSECNEKTFSQLESILSPLRLRRFGQTQVMCYVIDYRSPAQLKFDLFRRLNTGGKPLNNQEIRNCLSRPDVQNILRQMVSQPSFALATDNSVKDIRMDAREAALRFIYFYEQYSEANPVGDYTGDLENTLDEFVDELNKRSPESMIKYVEIYDNCLKNAFHLFGKHCFRKVLPENLTGRRNAVSKILMLTISILLTKYPHTLISSSMRKDSLIEPISNFIAQRPGLFETLTYGTSNKSNIENSLIEFKGFLENQINTI